MKPLSFLNTDSGSIYYCPGKTYTRAEKEVLEKIMDDRLEGEQAAIRAVRNFDAVPRKANAAR